MTSEQVMLWARRVEAQKAQSAILDNLNEKKRLSQNIQKKQSTKAKWDVTMRTNQNVHETEIQVLWLYSCVQTISSIWKCVQHA